eukprot:2544658-Pyramimonas_sp.AAC.1
MTSGVWDHRFPLILVGGFPCRSLRVGILGDSWVPIYTRHLPTSKSPTVVPLPSSSGSGLKPDLRQRSPIPHMRPRDFFRTVSLEVPTLSPGPACRPESFFDGPGARR